MAGIIPEQQKKAVFTARRSVSKNHALCETLAILRIGHT
jgi:hypothetical protein